MWRSMQLAYYISKTYRAIESRSFLSSPVEKGRIDIYIILVEHIRWGKNLTRVLLIYWIFHQYPLFNIIYIIRNFIAARVLA